MIDLALLRQEPTEVSRLIKLKDPTYSIDKLIELDIKVRQLKNEIEFLRSEKNRLAKLASINLNDQIRQESIDISKQLKNLEATSNQVELEFKNLYLNCPNIPDKNLPEGGKESNQVIKVFGKKPEFKFEPRNHVELGKINNWFDFEAAAKMAASNFALYKGDGVKVVYSLMLYMLNNNISNGFLPILPPYLVNEAALEGSGNFPRFKDEVYSISDDKLYLTPTSEVNLTRIYSDHIFSVSDLPVKMTSWTSCFRREAGGYGAHERGLIRIHQFEKVELYTITNPENVDNEQEKMVACAENILQSLGLHYRVSLLAMQDCSFASAKTYDIEIWMPGQQVYKEVSSVSNCTDFQARRSGIRYKQNLSDKTRLVYTLNGSSLALPRLLVALMEAYQQEDGSIKLPEVLKNIKLL